MTIRPHSREEKQKYIFDACNNAYENGYNNILAWTPEELASDLQFYDFVAENMDYKELVSVVTLWQEDKRKG